MKTLLMAFCGLVMLSGCASTKSSALNSRPDNPHNDSLYIVYSKQPIDSLTAIEYRYIQQKDHEYQNWLDDNKQHSFIEVEFIALAGFLLIASYLILHSRN